RAAKTTLPGRGHTAGTGWPGREVHPEPTAPRHDSTSRRVGPTQPGRSATGRWEAPPCLASPDQPATLEVASSVVAPGSRPSVRPPRFRTPQFSSAAGGVDVEAWETGMPAASAATPCSLMLLPGEDEVNRPAAADVGAWAPEVVEDFRVGTA